MAVARIPARSPSASASAWPSAIPVSSTVWCAPVSRSPADLRRRGPAPRAGRAVRACGRRTRRRSRSPAPRCRRARARRSRRSRRSAGRSRRCGSWRPIWRIRADIDSACTAKPSARGDRDARPGERRGGVADPHLAHPAAEGPTLARRRTARRPRSGGCGSNPRRSRRRPSRSRPRRRRSPARVIRGASASAAAPISSGARARAPRRRPRRAGSARRRAPSARRDRRAVAASASTSRPPRRQRAVVARPPHDRVVPCSAWASRSSATAPGRRPSGEHQQLARSGEAVDPDRPETWRLASCTQRLPGPDDHVDGRDRLGAVGERGDGARRPAVDLVHAEERAGGEDRPGAPARRRDLPDAGGVRGTAPMTTVDGYGVAPARHVDRGATRPEPRAAAPLALRESGARSSPQRGRRDVPDVRDATSSTAITAGRAPSSAAASSSRGRSQGPPLPPAKRRSRIERGVALRRWWRGSPARPRARPSAPGPSARTRPRSGVGPPRGQPADQRGACRIRATTVSIAAARSLWATGLAISRAVDLEVCSRSRVRSRATSCR